MSIQNIRKREIKKCVELKVKDIARTTELEFNKEQHHKSGRSGDHGKKFNKISTAISNFKNNTNGLNSTLCFQNDEEKNFVTEELTKHSKQYQQKAKSINHPSR